MDHGPAYRDPKKDMRQKIALADLDKALAGMDPRNPKAKERIRSSMDRNIERMCNNFFRYADRDNYITVEEFRKYEVLFSNKTREMFENAEATVEDELAIQELSQEWYRNYNPQKPTHIVDHNGKDVMPPLPPLFRKISMLKGSAVDALNELHHAFVNDDGQAGSVMDVKRSKAISDVWANLRSAQLNNDQNRKQMAQDIISFRAQADAVNRAIHGLPPVEATLPKTSGTPVSQTSASDEDLEYAPVDE